MIKFSYNKPSNIYPKHWWWFKAWNYVSVYNGKRKLVYGVRILGLEIEHE